MKANEAADYFRSSPGFERAFQQMHKKWRSYGRCGGNVCITDPTDVEREALGRYFSRDFSDGPVKFSLADFSRTLAETKFGAIDLYDVLCAYFDEDLKSKRQDAAAEEERLETRLEALLRQAKPIAGEGWPRKWLASITLRQYRQLLKGGTFSTEANADAAVLACAGALNYLEHGRLPVRLSVLAMEVTGNPHGLDQRTGTGSLFLKALQAKEHESGSLSGEEVLDLYVRSQIRPDAISSFTVVQGMHMYGADGLHPAYEGHLVCREYYLVSLSQLQNILAIRPVHVPVFILENQMVYSELCMHYPEASMICTSGQMKTASLLVIDMLAKAHVKMLYSSDLDPEGIGMADRLCQRHPDWIRPWRMTPQDYELCKSSQELSQARLKELEHVVTPQLQEAARCLEGDRLAGYQERLIPLMLADIGELTGQDTEESSDDRHGTYGS
ncbi:MAG: TIGR02679 domain-containing protein [Galactobacillus timonensis]|nr:TIGR02679 domain-containing protein [Galactobacillus timonensis]